MFKLQITDKRFKKYEWDGRGRLWLAKYEPGMEHFINEEGQPIIYTQTTEGIAQFIIPSDGCYIGQMIMYKSYTRKEDANIRIDLPYILTLYLTQNELDDMVERGMLTKKLGNV